MPGSAASDNGAIRLPSRWSGNAVVKIDIMIPACYAVRGRTDAPSRAARCTYWVGGGINIKSGCPRRKAEDSKRPKPEEADGKKSTF